MAIVLPALPPASSPPPAIAYAAPVLGSCASCCVRKYCAMYAPAHAGPPANCPFGPGPAGPQNN